MTILGRGDLSPPRRYRPGARRRWPRLLLTLVVLAALAAGGWFGWQRWHDDRHGGGPAAVLRPCVTPTTPPAATSVAGPAVNVLNGSLRSGLAARVARGMHRSFHVAIGRVGNAPRFMRGSSSVRYPTKLSGQANAVAAMIVPAPRLVVAAAASRVELDIGTAYQRLATVTEYRRNAPPTSATPPPAPTASSCHS
jgi:hypothetical protein